MEESLLLGGSAATNETSLSHIRASTDPACVKQIINVIEEHILPLKSLSTNSRILKRV